MPHLMPENGYPDEFVANDIRLRRHESCCDIGWRCSTNLLNDFLAVLSHVIHDGLRSVLPRCTRGLGRYCERVH